MKAFLTIVFTVFITATLTGIGFAVKYLGDHHPNTLATLGIGFIVLLIGFIAWIFASAVLDS